MSSFHYSLLLIPIMVALMNCIRDISAVDNNRDRIILSEVYQTRWFEGLRYGLFVLQAYDSTISYPLIIPLYRYTDTTSWNLSLYIEPIVSEDPCIVFTPKTMNSSA